MAFTQDGRLIAIETSLGKDALLLQGFTGQEGISRLFSFQLDLLAERPVALKSLLGQQVAVSVLLPDGGTRYFNGVVCRFALLGSERRFFHYRAELVPWLWFLTRTADCRIFQNQSIPDILVKIFKDLGFSAFKNQIQGVAEPREYCVQYRETDFNFVSRLMEQYGIFYFFEHEATKHTLVLANSPNAHKPCPAQARVRFESVANALEQEDVITGWQREQEFRPGKVTLRDYCFETPSTRLESTVEGALALANSKKYELYDYPGEYQKKPQGDQLVKLRIEEEEAPHLLTSGTSTCRAFVSGYKFDLEGQTPADKGSYLLTRIRHVASVGETYATGGQSEAEGYTNDFVCMPAKVPLRPPRTTPRPTVLGCQTAVVVGKKGEEIWTDKYGRVKVQFHWDREGKLDEHSTCWMRVAQNFAGKRWGATFTPRIGQEVVVDFLEGDPDQPIIIGSVYNAEHMPPYALPGEQTKSIIKSYSSKGGGGFNELRLEDKKGEEQLFLHAERNQDVRVKNDSFESIVNERHLIVVQDQVEQVQGDKHLHVNGDQNEKIDGTFSHKAGMDVQKKCGMNYALDAGMEIHLKSGLNLVLEAGLNLSAKVGANFVNITPAGIFIQGLPMLMLNPPPGAPAGMGSGASPQPPKDPKEADKDTPGEAARVPTQTPGVVSPQAIALRAAARKGAPFCEKCAEAAYAAAIARGATEDEARAEADRAGRAGAAPAPAAEAELHERARGAVEPGAPAPVARLAEPAPTEEKTWVGIELVDQAGQPVAGEPYRVVLADGRVIEDVLDANGRARIEDVAPGQCTVSFPNLRGGGANLPTT